MKNKNASKSQKPSRLRKQAEANLRKQKGKSLKDLSDQKVQVLVHELQVHQIELEMQNEELHNAQMLIEESRNKYSDLYDFAPVGYFTLDKKGLILEANLTGVDLLELEKSALMKKPFSRFIHRKDQDLFYLHCHKVFESMNRQTCEIRLKRKSGSLTYIRMISIPVQDSEGTYNQIRTAVSNITEQMELQKENIHLASFPELNPNPVIELNSSGEVTYVNPSGARLFPDLMVKGIKHPLCADFSTMQELFKTGDRVSHVRTINVDNEWYEQAISYVRESGHIRFYFQNITSRKKMEETIKYYAYHDVLTGLPNRTLFTDHFNLALSQASRSGNMVAVLFLDLDNFKTINDSLGHTIGDQLLKAAANLLRSCLRESDTVARFGGDEFIILFPATTRADEVVVAVTKIISAFQKPFLIDNHKLIVTVSAGISLYPLDGKNVDTLLKNADAAMYKAKEKGKNRYQFYTTAINRKYVDSIKPESRLRKGIKSK